MMLKTEMADICFFPQVWNHVSSRVVLNQTKLNIWWPRFDVGIIGVAIKALDLQPFILARNRSLVQIRQNY